MLFPKIMHFIPQERQLDFVSFLRHFLQDLYSKHPEVYISFEEAEEFKNILRSRINEPDIAIITAHGSNHAILQSNESGIGFTKVIPLHDANLFKHDFIFAFSCFTAQTFGPKVIEEKALVYIGFDDSIEDDIIYPCASNQEISDFFQTLYRQMCMEAIGNALQQFITECHSAEKFRQNIDINFKLKVISLGETHPYNLLTEKGIAITEEVDKILKLIPLSFISKFKNMQKKLQLLGDKYYIPWCFIHTLDTKQLNEVLKNINLMKTDNNYYKYFIQLLVYRSMNNTSAYNATSEDFQKAIKDLHEDGVDFNPSIIIPKSIA